MLLTLAPFPYIICMASDRRLLEWFEAERDFYLKLSARHSQEKKMIVAKARVEELNFPEEFNI